MSQKVLLIKNLTNALICGVIAFFVRYFMNEAYQQIPDNWPTQLLDIKLANKDVLKPRGVQDAEKLNNTLVYDSMLCAILVFVAIFLETLVVQATKASIFKYMIVNIIIITTIVTGTRYALWKFEVLQKIPSKIPVIGGVNYLNETNKELGTTAIYTITAIVTQLAKKLIATIMCAEVTV